MSSCIKDVFYDIGGRPFLSTQTLTDIEKKNESKENIKGSLSFCPPGFTKWLCKISNINFETNYPNEFKYLNETVDIEEFRIENENAGISIERDSDVSVSNHRKNEKKNALGSEDSFFGEPGETPPPDSPIGYNDSIFDEIV